MRIIAGEFRGRRLLAPDFKTTRPVTDRVKQSLFDILTPLLESARVYDLFSGTGSMGLESLSRGAAFATFFDADRTALAGLRRNIETLGVGSRSKVVAGDVFTYFNGKPTPERGTEVNLVFLDPPYRYLNERPDSLRLLAESLCRHLSDSAVVVLRHDHGDAIELPGLTAIDERRYGGMVLRFLKHSAAGEGDRSEKSMSEDGQAYP